MVPAGIETATCRFITQLLNHCATAVPRICSTYCFATATMVTRTRLNGTLYYIAYLVETYTLMENIKTNLRETVW